MPRFSITQMLMGVAFVAIALALLQAEGCGEPVSKVAAVEFSPNGSKVLATRVDARRGHDGVRGYWSNVSRVVSLFDASDGAGIKVVREELRSGKQGPSRLIERTWTHATFAGEEAVLLRSDNNAQLTIQSFEGQSKRELDLRSADYFEQFSISPDGAKLLAVGFSGARLVDVENGAALYQHTIEIRPFPVPAFSPDGRWVAFAAVDGVCLINTVAKRLRPLNFDAPRERDLNDISLLPDGSVLLATMDGLKRFNPSTTNLRQLTAAEPCWGCDRSENGEIIAGFSHDKAEVFDTKTGDRLLLFQGDIAHSIDLSPDGRRLAIGHRDSISVVDIASGNTVWTSTAPGRYRLPWTVPAAMLAGWIWVARKLALRGKTTAPVQPEVQITAGEPQ